MDLPEAKRCRRYCTECLWTSGEHPDDGIAGALATWHIFERHPEVWLRRIGDRRPNVPDPRNPGIYQLMLIGSPN